MTLEMSSVGVEEVFRFSLFFFFFFVLAVPGGLRDLSSPTRDQIQGPGSERVES